MFTSPLFFEFLLVSTLLIIASVDDLRSRKIHNKLLLFLLPFVLIAAFFIGGVKALVAGFFLAVLVLLCGIPLNLVKFIGGGDLKLLVVLSFTMHWSAFVYTLCYALVWASLLGLFKVILDKQLKHFILNLFIIVKFRSIEKSSLHTIPFSLCLLFGWLSYFTWRHGIVF